MPPEPTEVTFGLSRHGAPHPGEEGLMSRDTQAGFTLVEFLTVVVIIGLMTALVVNNRLNEEGMIDLYDNATDSLMGQIPESQLRFLVDHLEETDLSDRDYYIDLATLEMLEEQGAAEALVQLLRKALGEREGMDVRWEEAQGSAS